MMVFALIGAKALYLLFIWLISAAGGAWLAERKGYGERLGLTFGLLLTAVGLLIVLLLPGRPGSAWKEEGWLPRRKQPPVREGLALPDGSALTAPSDGDEGRGSATPPADRPPPAQAPPPDAQ
jgi:hypothetical protein